MRFIADTLGLSGHEFALLRDLIHERTGLDYDDGKSGLLMDKLSPRVVEHGFDSFLDYYYLLKYDPAAEEEWRHVVDVLAVPETYFWREFDQIRALVDVILPAHLESARRREPFRIWSAASASGEEPLSIAMALNEAGWFTRLNVEIYASDASTAAINRAQAGIYRERSFRALAPELRRRYFRRTPDGEKVIPELQARVQWKVANLVQADEVALLARANAIFCRNVFIYFSQAAIRKVVATFVREMPSPGYLFLGISESLLRVTTSFELREVGGAFVYVKP